MKVSGRRYRALGSKPRGGEGRAGCGVVFCVSFFSLQSLTTFMSFFMRIFFIFSLPPPSQ